MSEFETGGALIVSWDFTRGQDVGVLIVGKQVPMKPIGNRIEIINAFQGDEAIAIYEMLTKKKEATADAGE
ncbi:MAG: hypothetical protein IKZ08_02475 [Bacteroidales bacterium]|nr:hypothetical protein [Bacteroidales bacterium]